mgnify:CR=1 FL=1
MNKAYVVENQKEILFFKNPDVTIRQYISDEAQLKHEDGVLYSEDPNIVLKLYSKYSTVIGRAECEMKSSQDVQGIVTFYFYPRFMNNKQEREKVVNTVLDFLKKEKIYDEVVLNRLYEIRNKQ